MATTGMDSSGVPALGHKQLCISSCIQVGQAYWQGGVVGALVLEPSKTGMYVKYPYCGDAYQYALPKMGTYLKYPYLRLHGSSTLVTLPT